MKKYSVGVSGALLRRTLLVMVCEPVVTGIEPEPVKSLPMTDDDRRRIRSWKLVWTGPERRAAPHCVCRVVSLVVSKLAAWEKGSEEHERQLSTLRAREALMAWLISEPPPDEDVGSCIE
jgi:hypothetical protein